MRELIFAGTWTIIRTNYPYMETWLSSHADVTTWTRPEAGAIVYAHVDLPVKSRDLVERFARSRACSWCPARCSA